MRFSFKSLLPSLFGSLALAASTTISAQTVHVTYNVAEGSSWDRGAQVFKEEVETNSNGAYKVNLHPNAAMAGGNDRVELEMVQGGAIQFLIKSTTWLTGLNPKFQVLGLPWLFPSHDVANAVMDGEAGQALMKTLEEKDLVGIAWGVNGFRQVTNSRRAITEPADLKNMKIRVPGIPLYLDIFKSLGANPTTMSFSEVFTALQTKTVDGQENPMSLIWSSHFYDVQKHMTIWNYSYDAIAFVASSRFWSTLDESDQQMFLDAARKAMDFERQVVKQEDDDLPDKLREAGMEVTILSEDQLSAFQDALQPVYDTYKETLDPEFVELFERGVEDAR